MHSCICEGQSVNEGWSLFMMYMSPNVQTQKYSDYWTVLWSGSKLWALSGDGNNTDYLFITAPVSVRELSRIRWTSDPQSNPWRSTSQVMAWKHLHVGADTWAQRQGSSTLSMISRSVRRRGGTLTFNRGGECSLQSRCSQTWTNTFCVQMQE